MSDVANLISQLEQHKASIDRAIEALREITNTTAASDKAARSAPAQDSDERPEGRHITSAGRQRLAEAMKRRWAAKRAAGKKAKKNADAKGSTSVGTSTSTERRSMTPEQKRAISKAWTPERKQKFAEFHVKRMARERGEDPAKALREYRRRKQREQAGTRPAAKSARKVGTKAPARKSAMKKTPSADVAAKSATAATATAAT